MPTVIYQGSVGKMKEGTPAAFAYEAGKPVLVEVAVDRDGGEVRMTLPGQVVEPQLERPMKAIVGYRVINSAIEFSPLQSNGQ